MQQYKFVKAGTNNPYHGPVVYELEELIFSFGIIEFIPDIKLEVELSNNELTVKVIDNIDKVLEILTEDHLINGFKKLVESGGDLRYFKNSKGEYVELLID